MVAFKKLQREAPHQACFDPSRVPPDLDNAEPQKNPYQAVRFRPRSLPTITHTNPYMIVSAPMPFEYAPEIQAYYSILGTQHGSSKKDLKVTYTDDETGDATRVKMSEPVRVLTQPRILPKSKHLLSEINQQKRSCEKNKKQKTISFLVSPVPPPASTSVEQKIVISRSTPPRSKSHDEATAFLLCNRTLLVKSGCINRLVQRRARHCTTMCVCPTPLHLLQPTHAARYFSCPTPHETSCCT